MNLGSGECTEPSLVWNQLIILSCFQACGVQKFHSQEFFVWNQFCILKKSMALFHIWFFHVILHNFQIKNFSIWVTRGSYVGYIQIALWVSGSSGSTGVTHFQPWLGHNNLCIMLHNYRLYWPQKLVSILSSW